jgi:hypothetical protein
LKGKNYAQQINSNYFSIAITTHVNSAPLNPSGPEAKQLEAMGFEVKVLSGTAHFEHYERNPTCPLSDQIKNRQKDSDKKVLDVRR